MVIVLGRVVTWRYPRSRALPRSPRREFELVAAGYCCSVNRNTRRELESYAPKVDNNLMADETFIGVFGRIIKMPPKCRGLRCYQYLFVWDGQRFPWHPMDYEPVFVFVNRYGNPITVLFDKRHYKIGRHLASDTSSFVLKIKRKWHQFSLSHYGYRGHDYPIQELTDDHIRHWWDFSQDAARLKIRENLLDPLALNGVDNFSAHSPPLSPHLGEQLIISMRIPLLAFGLMSESLSDLINNLIDGLVRPSIAGKKKEESVIVSAWFVAFLYQGLQYDFFEIERGEEFRAELARLGQTLMANVSIGELLDARDANMFSEFIRRFASEEIGVVETERGWEEFQAMLEPEDEDEAKQAVDWLEQHRQGVSDISIHPDFLATFDPERKPRYYREESLDVRYPPDYKMKMPISYPPPLQNLVNIGTRSPYELLNHLLEIVESPWTDRGLSEFDDETDSFYARVLFEDEGISRGLLDAAAERLEVTETPWIVLEAIGLYLSILPKANLSSEKKRSLVKRFDALFVESEDKVIEDLTESTNPWKILTSLSSIDHFLKSKRLAAEIGKHAPSIGRAIEMGWIPESHVILLMKYEEIRLNREVIDAVRSRGIMEIGFESP